MQNLPSAAASFLRKSGFTKFRRFWGQSSLYRGQKSRQTFFVQSFLRTLRVMDVRAENRGRPHQQMRFSAAPVMGRNFLTPGHPGVRVRNVRRKSGPKSLCLCCFSSLTIFSYDTDEHAKFRAGWVSGIGSDWCYASLSMQSLEHRQSISSPASHESTWEG